MITEQDLKQAIAECQGVRDPNANTCIKLAAYYIILEHMQAEEKPIYSYAPPPQAAYISDSEFGMKIQGKDTNAVLAVMDELMSTISILNSSLYNGVMRKLSEI